MPKEKLLAEWFWIDRWMGSSAFALPIAARGLYREMMTQAWLRNARLPNNADQIRRMTGVTLKEWKRTWPLVRRYWRKQGSSLVNDTQIIVYAEALARAERSAGRARKAAQARWEAYAQASPEQCPPISSHQSPVLKKNPPTPRAGGRLTRKEREEAETLRNRVYGGCPHEPRHQVAADCVREIVLERRSKAS